MTYEETIRTGKVGNFSGWRIGGKSYDPKGNLIKEDHDESCFCCRNITLLSSPKDI